MKKYLFSPARALAATAGFAAVVVAASAQAAITALDLAPIGDDIEASLTALTPWVIGLLALTLGASIGIKLLKKFANRAA
jgi:hypothetical protein